MSLVNRIQNLCSSKNTTLIGLEREIGIGRGTIRNWDKSSPSIDKVQKVAEYFGVSTDYLLYGFNKSEFTSLVNITRHKRSVKEFANDTGLDEYYLARLCSGVEYKQPDVETVLSIAIANKNDWLVDIRSLFTAAGYDFDDLVGELLADIPIDHLHHYQEQGMSDAQMVVAHAQYKKAVLEDAMHDPTIAAHQDSDDWTEEQPNNSARKKLTPKEERDIVKDLERIMADLEHNQALAFHGEPIDEEEMELLRASLENSLRVAKMVAKKKFTPKKYRK